MMTCYVVVSNCKRLKINMKEEKVLVSKIAASMTGTSAVLYEGDELTVWDALHGLMLPSGNDAAMVLAEKFGEIFYKESRDY